MDNERNPCRKDWEVFVEHIDPDGDVVTGDGLRGYRAFPSRESQLQFVRRLARRSRMLLVYTAILGSESYEKLQLLSVIGPQLPLARP
ncbi:hypothetical protein [Kibdelosporangium aridum]|uniref:hypothetical protein n=1 Tax=Kibdelosporangium aridum TaxID=2030 RepID=UPI00190E6D3A|nr:hypothetical protein [Kibdelosporangium aridum]